MVRVLVHGNSWSGVKFHCSPGSGHTFHWTNKGSTLVYCSICESYELRQTLQRAALPCPVFDEDDYLEPEPYLEPEYQDLDPPEPVFNLRLDVPIRGP